MKITDIVRRSSEIVEGQEAFFIADVDFKFKGLPILKDSLVWYDGDGKVQVNMILLGIFQPSNVPHIVSASLPKVGSLDCGVDKVSACPAEYTMLDLSSWGIWHNDHFDQWTGKFADYLPRILDLGSLEYDGIKFSPLMYEFNPLSSELYYYISTENNTLLIDDKEFEIPKLLEINQTERRGNGPRYLLIPIQGEMEYMGLLFSGAPSLDSDGVFKGSLAEDIVVEYIDKPGAKHFTVEKGVMVAISHDGRMSIRAYLHESGKAETVDVRFVGRSSSNESGSEGRGFIGSLIHRLFGVFRRS